MRNILACCMTVLCFLQVQAQLPQGGSLDAGDYVQIPKSPEAFAFSEYGNVPVSLYEGRAQISIPLGAITGRTYSLPVNLTYSGDAIKVDQLASEVGLGWNLQLGGMVTREVHGKPDDYISGGSYFPFYSTDWDAQMNNSYKGAFDLYKASPIAPAQQLPGGGSSEAQIDAYVAFMKRARDGNLEMQPDLYSFSVNGLSGKFYIDYDLEIGYVMEDPSIKVDVNLASPSPGGVRSVQGWTITDAAGNQYEFNQAEVTETFDDNSGWMNNNAYNSSWHLTKITSGDKKDIMIFNYAAGTPWSQQQLAAKSKVYQARLASAPDDQACAESESINANIKYVITQPELSSVSINGVLGFDVIRYPFERFDLKGKKAISGLRFRNVMGQETNYVEFAHDYAGNPTSSFDWDSRLILKEVRTYYRSTVPEVHTFEYDRLDLIPSRESNGRDFWGYFNGESSSQELVPQNSLYDDQLFGGGNRDANASFNTIGMLTKINYPTGGYSNFHYQTPQIVNNTSQVVETQVLSVTTSGGQTPGVFCDDGVTGIPYDNANGVSVPPGDYTLELTISGQSNGNQAHPLFFATFVNGPVPQYCSVFDDSNFNPIFLHTGSPATMSQTVTVPVGSTYSMRVVNNIYGVTATLRLYKLETVSNNTTTTVGSPRVYKVETGTSSGIAKTKYYYYGSLAGNTPSSINTNTFDNHLAGGTLQQKIKYEVPLRRQKSDGTYCEFMQRHSTNQSVATPYVMTYPIVTEVEYDAGSNTHNGLKISYFHDQLEAQSGSHYVKYFPLNGKLFKSQAYRINSSLDTYELISEESTDYSVVSVYGGYTGIQIAPTEFRYVDWMLKEDSASNNVYYEWDGFLDGSANPCQLMNTIVTGFNPYLSCYQTGPQMIYEQRLTGRGRYKVQMDKTSSSSFENGITLTDETTYRYGGTFYLLKEKTFKDAFGNTYSEHYQHPETAILGIGPNNGYTDLYADHRVGEVVITSLKKDGIIKRHETKFYEKSGNYVRLSKLQVYLNSGTGEDRLQLTYDGANNVAEVLKNPVSDEGIFTSYVWGYNNSLPILKVVGASIDQVVDTINAYASLSIPAADGGQAYSAAQHQTLANALGEGTLIETYQYFPGVGMTLQRDPNGKETTFSYNAQNRLDNTRDHSGNMTNAWNYNVGESFDRNLQIQGSLDFGEVAVGESVTQNITLSNSGADPLEITGIGVALGGLTHNAPNILNPGASVNVSFTLQPTILDTVGVFNLTGAVFSNKTSGASDFPVTGSVVKERVLSADWSTHNFNSVLVGTSGTRVVRLTNTGDGSVTVTGFGAGTPFSASWTGTVAAGSYQDVTISYSPANKNASNETVNFASNETGDKVALQLSGSGLSRELAISSLNIGDADIYTAKTGTLVLSNPGNQALSVYGLSYSNSEFSGNWSGTIPAGGSRNVTVTFSSSNPGSRSTTVTVNSNMTNGSSTNTITAFTATRTLNLSLDGNFGAVDITYGGYIYRTLTVTNTGNRHLSMTDVNVAINGGSGGSVTEDSNIPILRLVAPGASTTVNIGYRPATNYSGTQYFTTTVSSNKTSGNNVVGSSIFVRNRILTLSWQNGGANFGAMEADLDVTTTVNHTMRLANWGNDPLTITSFAETTASALFYATNVPAFPLTLSPNGGFVDITITSNPSQIHHGLGVSTSVFSWSSNRTSGTDNVTITGSAKVRHIRFANGAGQSDIAPTLNFGSQNIDAGPSAGQTFTVFNVGNQPVNITITGNTYFQVSGCATGGSMNPGDSRICTVKFDPVTTATYNNGIGITTNVNIGDPTTSVPVTGVGTNSSSPPGPPGGGDEH